MFEQIKKDIATILTDAGTRKRTTLNRLDKSVFEDIESTAMRLYGQVSELEKQIKKEQRENEQKEADRQNRDTGYTEQPQQAITKPATPAKPKAKRTTVKKRLSIDKKPSRKQK